MKEINSNIWPKQISVDKRIVKILSEATYEDFPNSLRELIVNSYDADATRVDVKIDLNKEVILIEDNGWGMSERDFSHYIRIAAEPKKIRFAPSGRIKIGKFGVGFLSVFPFFKSYNIEATREGSSEILFASIPCSDFFSSDQSINLDDIMIQGGTKIDQKITNVSYTKIRLKGFTQLCQSFFHPAYNNKPRKNSILKLSGIDRLKWKLAEDLPINYENKKFSNVFKIFSPNLSFEVFFNGVQLLRPIFGDQILESTIGSPKEIGKIKYQYFIATSKIAVDPSEAKYLKIRNLNVGVGYRTNFGLGTDFGGARSRLNWLTGEIHVLSGMNDLITVSRDNFNFNPDYEELKDFFIKRLAYYSNRLEEEAEIVRFVKQTHDESKISNLKLLEPRIIKNKIEKLKSSEVIKTEELERLIEHSANNFIFISDKKYKVSTANWDYKKEFYPALKIIKNTVIINSKYPLFRAKKHTDLFIKLHLLMVNKLDDNTINKVSYKKIVDEFLSIFKEYF